MDYIEESVNQTQENNNSLQHNSVTPGKAGDEGDNQNAHRMTLNDFQSQVGALKDENAKLTSLNADMMHKMADLESKLQMTITSAREETFGNLPTGLTARSPQMNGGN